MIKILLIPGLIMMSCGATKSNQTAVEKDSVNISTRSENGNDSLNKASANTVQLPSCIKNKIDSFKVKAVHERPQKIVSYRYKGAIVYYVEMPCCDFFNEVYDARCNYLGAPDGGITGKGDGKIPDFTSEAKEVKLIWKSEN